MGLDMPLNRETKDKLLPTSIGGRIVLGLLSAMLIPFAGGFLFILVGPRPIDLAGYALQIVLVEFFTSLLVISGIGLAWAVAKPPWLVPLAERAAGRMVLCLFIPLDSPWNNVALGMTRRSEFPRTSGTACSRCQGDRLICVRVLLRYRS